MKEEYTIILNYFNKSVDLMKHQLDRVFNQDSQPKCVIACFLGMSLESTHVKEYLKFIEENNCKNWSYVISDYNFKYIGRYQIALNVETEYIVMLDDDRIPCLSYCGGMVSFAKKSNAIIQQYGWILKKQSNGTYSDGDGYFFTPMITPANFYKLTGNKPYINVDYLCGGMVFHKKHLVNLFYEQLDTNITGEDIIFCMKSKNNKIPILCYYPYLDENSDYFSNTHSFLEHKPEDTFSTLKDGKVKNGIIKETRDFLINKYKQ